jgi:hypothetical protein
MEKIYFLGFYTDGENDGCFDLRNCVNEIKTKLNPYFEKLLIFNKKDIKNMPNSEDICNEYDEPLNFYNGMVINEHSNKIGYFDFKPFLIDYALKNLIPENSIVLYHDLNFEKCPQYWESDWENIKGICEKVLNDNSADFFSKAEHDGALVKMFVKTHTLDTIFTNHMENLVVKESKLFGAGQLIIRNTPFSKQLVSEWLTMCRDKSLIAKEPNPNPHPEFQWGCGDQDALNCLLFRYILDGKMNPNYPRYYFKYRVLRLENRPFDYPRQNWNPHPTGLVGFENSQLMELIRQKNR